MTELDQLLSAPLAEIRDDGFSIRVMLRVEQEQFRRRMIVQGLVLAACLIGFLLLLPYLAQQGQMLPQTAGLDITKGVQALLAFLFQPTGLMVLGAAGLSLICDRHLMQA